MMQSAHPNLRMLDNPRGIVATGMNIGIAAARVRFLSVWTATVLSRRTTCVDA